MWENGPPSLQSLTQHFSRTQALPLISRWFNHIGNEKVWEIFAKHKIWNVICKYHLRLKVWQGNPVLTMPEEASVHLDSEASWMYHQTVETCIMVRHESVVWRTRQWFLPWNVCNKRSSRLFTATCPRGRLCDCVELYQCPWQRLFTLLWSQH